MTKRPPVGRGFVFWMRFSTKNRLALSSPGPPLFGARNLLRFAARWLRGGGVLHSRRRFQTGTGLPVPRSSATAEGGKSALRLGPSSLRWSKSLAARSKNVLFDPCGHAATNHPSGIGVRCRPGALGGFFNGLPALRSSAPVFPASPANIFHCADSL